MKKLLNPTLITLLIFTLFTWCKKDGTELDNETQSAVDDAISEQEFMAVPPAALQCAVNSMRTVNYKISDLPCDTLTKISGDTLWGTANHVDPTYTMSVSNATCSKIMPDGKTRTGSLYIRLTGRLHEAGTKMIIKFKDYVADGISFSSDSIIVTTSSLTLNEMQYNIKVINGLLQTSSYSIKFNMDRTISAHDLTGSNPYINVYGTADGVNREKRKFTVTVPQSNPLTKHNNCPYIDKGILQLTPDGFKTRTVDFGDGTCDENASFTVNGNTIAFKLK